MARYDHEVRGLEDSLTHTQHHHAKIIRSTMHIHLSDRECLETIAVKGNNKEIRKLSDELAAKRGVKMLRTIVVSV
jgi:CopG family nickel-responsive transcriptional regulator